VLQIPKPMHRFKRPAAGCILWIALAVADPIAADAATADATPQAIRDFVAQADLHALHHTRLADARAELTRFYAPRGYAPAWFVDGVPRTQADTAVRLLDDAAAHGLNPADYDAARLRIELASARRSALDAPAIARLDTAVTIAMFHYLTDLHLGRVDPHRLGWSLEVTPKPDEDLAAALRDAMERNALPEAVARAEPPLPIYRRLMAALAAYRQLPPDLAIELPADTLTLHPGDTYADLPALARVLTTLGDLPPGTAIAGDVYDGAWVEGVRRFQERHGLEADGLIGKATAAALGVPIAQRVRQIELALERLRWLPELPPGPLVAVNVPSFKLWAIRDVGRANAADLEMNVVVGRAGRTRTPIFMQDMRYVEFNPYWNVPRSILRNEMLPKLWRDPAYMHRQDLEFVAGDGAVYTYASDAVLASAAAGELRLRQRPGPDNALGRIKFALPNSMDIYMHDTPATALFERPRRDFSHGCIRVANPVALAEFVFSDLPEWSRAAILEAMASGVQQTVMLPRPIPVIIFYSTVVIDADGRLLFLPDIYGYDHRLDRAIEAADARMQ
jgi:murein L,D-transpeptidase YcbB/YkuD